MIDFRYIPVIFTIHLVSLVIRAVRQKLFLDAVGLKISLKNNTIIHFASMSMVVTPGASGEVIKTYFLKDKFGHSYTKTIPVVFAEKYYDLLSIITILAIFLFFSYSFDTQAIVFLIAVLLFGIFLIVRNNKMFQMLVPRMQKIPFLKRFANDIYDLQYPFRILCGRRVFVYGWFFGSLFWILDVVTTYLCFLSFHLNYGLVKSTLIIYLPVVIGALSMLPGGIGIVESISTSFLVKSGMSLSMGSALVVFIRLTSLWLFVGIGILTTKFILKKMDKNTI